MPDLRIAYFAHSLRSDWNNGNAHFLRGLARSMTAMGHAVTIFEPQTGWSIDNLRMETLATRSLADFTRVYPELDLRTYIQDDPEEQWIERLMGTQVVILHEWNPPQLARQLLALRPKLGFKLLFHDTHHRASSSPQQINQFGLDRFDGILAFGESLRRIYCQDFNIQNVWTLHEAADTTVFHPLPGEIRQTDVVWIGNWGEGERSQEIKEFFLKPACALASDATFKIYGVRYPADGLTALAKARVAYGGYLPNLDAPATYASSGITVHIPRQQYSQAMAGIPTIRVFEALACGIPLISAPWQDTEDLFREGDFLFVDNASQMTSCMRYLLDNPSLAEDQALHGLETILARHTCRHRAEELTAICEEIIR